MACKGGCDCHNQTEYQPCVDDPPCYNGCGSSPCAYAILAKCTIDSTQTPLNHITTLWRHCLYDATCEVGGFNCSGVWSARKHCGGIHPDVDPATFTGGQVENPECIAVGAEGDVVPHNPKCDGDYIGAMLFGCDQRPYNCNGCTWSPAELAASAPVWVLNVNGPPTGGYPPPPPTSGSEASIAVYVTDCGSSPPGTLCQVASYSIAPLANEPTPGFACLGRTSFRKAQAGTCFPDYQEIFKRLPDTICVVPYASNWFHPCGTNNSELCDCKDDGCPSFILDMTIEDCPTTIQSDVTFLRLTDGCQVEVGGVNPCGSITWPDATCGVFVGSINTTCPGAAQQRYLLFLAWCDGGTWTLRTYCILITGTTLNSVTNLGETSLERTDDCAITFEPVTLDLSDSDCCNACEVFTECCDDAIPATIYATLTATCAGLNGQVITLTYSANPAPFEYEWTGQITSGTCAGFNVKATTTDAGGGGCIFSLEITDPGTGIDCSNLQDSPRFDCPFVATDPFTASPAPTCSCCSGGTLSAVISV